jgi:crotonobetainyl-CoA:carnitine CoA-transferase CaiB-like acyl-CoA transferase
MEPRRLLTGIRVLDFTRVLAGPYCTRILQDLGAEVIKVERPVFGDDSRYYPHKVAPRYTGYHMLMNWGKKSITLDLKHPRVRPLVHGLVRVSDVLVENFSPGTMADLGLDYARLEKINPSLIYCSISVFGQTGMYANLPGYGVLAEAMSGAMEVAGFPDKPPVFLGLSLADISGAIHAFGAIMAALFARERGLGGQYIDIAMLACALNFHEIAIQQYILSGGRETMHRLGSQHPAVAPYGAFQGRDWVIVIAAANDHWWQVLSRVIGKPDLGKDPRFATNEARAEHRDEVTAVIEEWLKTQPDRETAITVLRKADVPCAPILTIGEVVEHPYFRERRMLVEMMDRYAGSVLMQNTPFRFSNVEVGISGQPPLLGEHTREVITGVLKHSDEEFVQLAQSGVFGPEVQGA